MRTQITFTLDSSKDSLYENYKLPQMDLAPRMFLVVVDLVECTKDALRMVHW